MIKKFAVGLSGLVALGALVSACDSKTGSTAPTTAAVVSTQAQKAAVATFKVWGSAPGGADISYGSDSEDLQGSLLPMTRTLPVRSGALYYDVNAQLMGSGDIHCSVTIGNKTRTGHASGGYNICMVQLNDGMFGGWE